MIRDDLCHESVDRQGYAQPCDKPAVAHARDREIGSIYPVCVYHVRKETAVPLSEMDKTRS